MGWPQEPSESLLVWIRPTDPPVNRLKPLALNPGPGCGGAPAGSRLPYIDICSRQLPAPAPSPAPGSDPAPAAFPEPLPLFLGAWRGSTAALPPPHNIWGCHCHPQPLAACATDADLPHGTGTLPPSPAPQVQRGSIWVGNPSARAAARARASTGSPGCSPPAAACKINPLPTLTWCQPHLVLAAGCPGAASPLGAEALVLP